MQAGPSSQKRGLHTSAERSTRHLPLEQSKSLLGEYGIQISTEPPPTSNASVLTVTVHRSKRQPCLIASPPGDTENTVKIPFDYNAGPDQSHTTQVADHTQLPAAELHNLVKKLWTLFREKEGASLSLTLHPDPSTSAVQVSTPRLIFDPAAFATAGRHASLHGSGSGAVAAPLAAHGMAYIALPADGGGLVGTLVNGAGLAMNTVDALAARGVCCANFLDTGGRATAEGVAAALRAILAAADGARPVRAVFVNAFGGLTRCDMVARGVLDAVREEGIAVPLVVRLRGTNEAEGQRLVAESGLGTVFAYDGFDEAAAKLRQLLDESEGGR
jgi:succinyl-CoA synthetase alpha subunit